MHVTHIRPDYMHACARPARVTWLSQDILCTRRGVPLLLLPLQQVWPRVSPVSMFAAARGWVRMQSTRHCCDGTYVQAAVLPWLLSHSSGVHCAPRKAGLRA
jgi:hypothetical protein